MMPHEPVNFRRLAPIVSAVLLGVLLFAGRAERIPIELIDAHNQRVSDAIDAIPYKIGNWLGRDEEVISAAVKLLKPNRILQRRYENQVTGYRISLLIVHCGTIRDMGGHHPPVCYPANGWNLRDTGARKVDVLGSSCQAREYRFDRPAGSTLVGINVTNFFVLPTGDAGIEDDLNALRRVGEYRERDILGVAQIQIVTPIEMQETDRAAAIDELIKGIEPVIKTIEDGIE